MSKIFLLVEIYKSYSRCSLNFLFCHFGYPKNFILLASRRERRLSSKTDIKFTQYFFPFRPHHPQIEFAFLIVHAHTQATFHPNEM